MGTKIFLENHGFKLVGDERDVMVPHRLQGQVTRWCRENNIAAVLNYAGSDVRRMVQQAFKMDLWSVRDEQQRAFFILRWACPV